MIQFTIQKVHVRVALLALLTLFPATLTFSQQKERSRKWDTAQKGARAASAHSMRDDKDEQKEGEREREVGPLQKGRARRVRAVDERRQGRKERRRPAVQGHEVPCDRPFSRRPLADRGWNSRRPDHLLFPRDRRRHLEIHRRREHLGPDF